MKQKQVTPQIITSISELHKILDLPKPKHPLISVLSFDDMNKPEQKENKNIVYNFYMICIKKDFDGKLKYGQNYYDFEEGIISYISPGQILGYEATPQKGWLLVFHPDFVHNYALGEQIKGYSFFSYQLSEALHLSETEEKMIENIFKDISTEYQNNIDQFSQDIIISQIDLLLKLSIRFYGRQFITRKKTNSDILSRLEKLLADYFDNHTIPFLGVPTVQYVSGQLNVSPNYLSDMLRSLTGQTTQQHIHNKLIDKSKVVLANTNLSVSEIAYSLGFEYVQSFNKLFKSKTNLSPMEYRNSFN